MSEYRLHASRVRVEREMRVLVVHPHAQERRRFVRVLANSGHQVAEAAEPTAALVRCRAEHPDVAILYAEVDNRLVAEIKADPHAYGTAIVMVTPPGLDPAAATQGLRRGVVDYLVEPVADGEVLARIGAAGRTKDLQHELVAVSVGVATWAQETPEQLLRRADAALYRAKEAGRDRVMAATLHGRT
jgi:PleD family two-component response regulator